MSSFTREERPEGKHDDAAAPASGCSWRRCAAATTLPESSEQSAAETNSDAPMVPPRPTATPARLVVRVSPVYPETGRRSNAPARVVVEVTVTTQGATEKASIIESTAPDEGFEQSALAAIEKWRYEPATQNGQPVEQRIRIVINFR
ncbi:MAG: energy transducer TonB [Acidobacteriota bacterium]